MIVTTWFNELGNHQREFDDKTLFFNNETILQTKNPRSQDDPRYPKTTLLEHFTNQHHYTKLLNDKNIEFQCKKGGGYETLNTEFYLPSKQNQDNFFIVSDSDLKIFGVFDGHGEFGHMVSGFASGIMLDYIRNKDKALRLRCLQAEDDSFDIDIRRGLRRCFKYT